jgi:(5-formylfuran-3-yl)methyl phosphate synthase
MTGMLASVCSIAEAKLVQESDIDIIDLKDPREGALGALELSVVKNIVDLIDGVTPVSATIGDIPFQAELLEPVIHNMMLTGVDIIKIGVFGNITGLSELAMINKLTQRGARIVLVIFAEEYDEEYDFEKLAETGLVGVMLDTMDKQSGSLRDKLSDSALTKFVDSANSYGLLSGLAGSLTVKDIPSLLAMAPDYLGFRGGLCQQGRRENTLDRETINTVRQKIPDSKSKIITSSLTV